MAKLIGLLITFVMFIIKKFFPWLIKKFGLSTVKSAIQKIASFFTVTTALAFYASVIVFLNESITMFRQVIEIINDPATSAVGSGGEYFSCFLYLMNATGIAQGFNSAMSFGMSVLIFFFLRGLYTITIKTSKLISDEISKSLKLI